MKAEMQNIYVRIGKYLRKRRLASNMSLAAAAKRTGMSRSNLNAIELGKQRAQIHQLHSLCRVLKIEFKLNGEVPNNKPRKE